MGGLDVVDFETGKKGDEGYIVRASFLSLAVDDTMSRERMDGFPGGACRNMTGGNETSGHGCLFLCVLLWGLPFVLKLSPCDSPPGKPR